MLLNHTSVVTDSHRVTRLSPTALPPCPPSLPCHTPHHPLFLLLQRTQCRDPGLQLPAYGGGGGAAEASVGLLTAIKSDPRGWILCRRKGCHSRALLESVSRVRATQNLSARNRNPTLNPLTPFHSLCSLPSPSPVAPMSPLPLCFPCAALPLPLLCPQPSQDDDPALWAYVMPDEEDSQIGTGPLVSTPVPQARRTAGPPVAASWRSERAPRRSRWMEMHMQRITTGDVPRSPSQRKVHCHVPATLCMHCLHCGGAPPPPLALPHIQSVLCVPPPPPIIITLQNNITHA